MYIFQKIPSLVLVAKDKLMQQKGLARDAAIKKYFIKVSSCISLVGNKKPVSIL